MSDVLREKSVERALASILTGDAKANLRDVPDHLTRELHKGPLTATLRRLYDEATGRTEARLMSSIRRPAQPLTPEEVEATKRELTAPRDPEKRPRFAGGQGADR